MADTPLNMYQRVPPPADPASASQHLDGELQKLERSVRDAVTRLQSLSGTYAPIADAVLTGDPKAPTPLTADNDTSIATTAFVKAQDYATHADLTSGLSTKADTSALSGYATTTALSTGLAGKADTTALASYAPLASPALTGSPTAPTQASGDNSTKLATTAYADAASPWKMVKKTTAQTVTSNSFVDDNALTFAMAANTTYVARMVLSVVSSAGGLSISGNGPASPTLFQLGVSTTAIGINAYNGQLIVTTTASPYVLVVNAMIQNGATAGNFVLRISTGQVSGNTTVQVGSYLEWQKFS